MAPISRGKSKNKPETTPSAAETLRALLADAGIPIAETQVIDDWSVAQRAEAEVYARAKIRTLDGPPAFLPQPEMEFDSPPAREPEHDAIAMAAFAGMLLNWTEQLRLLGDEATDASIAFDETCVDAMLALDEHAATAERNAVLDGADEARGHVRRFTALLRVLVKDLERERHSALRGAR